MKIFKYTLLVAVTFNVAVIADYTDDNFESIYKDPSLRSVKFSKAYEYDYIQKDGKEYYTLTYTAYRFNDPADVYTKIKIPYQTNYKFFIPNFSEHITLMYSRYASLGWLDMYISLGNPPHYLPIDDHKSNSYLNVIDDKKRYTKDELLNEYKVLSLHDVKDAYYNDTLTWYSGLCYAGECNSESKKEFFENKGYDIDKDWFMLNYLQNGYSIKYNKKVGYRFEFTNITPDANLNKWLYISTDIRKAVLSYKSLNRVVPIGAGGSVSQSSSSSVSSSYTSSKNITNPLKYIFINSTIYLYKDKVDEYVNRYKLNEKFSVECNNPRLYHVNINPNTKEKYYSVDYDSINACYYMFELQEKYDDHRVVDFEYSDDFSIVNVSSSSYSSYSSSSSSASSFNPVGAGGNGSSVDSYQSSSECEVVYENRGYGTEDEPYVLNEDEDFYIKTPASSDSIILSFVNDKTIGLEIPSGMNSNISVRNIKTVQYKLKKGWNLKGTGVYISKESIEKVLEDECVDSIYTFKNGEWKNYDEKGSKDIEYLEANDGFWIKALYDCNIAM